MTTSLVSVDVGIATVRPVRVLMEMGTRCKPAVPENEEQAVAALAWWNRYQVRKELRPAHISWEKIQEAKERIYLQFGKDVTSGRRYLHLYAERIRNRQRRADRKAAQVV